MFPRETHAMSTFAPGLRGQTLPLRPTLRHRQFWGRVCTLMLLVERTYTVPSLRPVLRLASKGPTCQITLITKWISHQISGRSDTIQVGSRDFSRIRRSFPSPTVLIRIGSSPVQDGTVHHGGTPERHQRDTRTLGGRPFGGMSTRKSNTKKYHELMANDLLHVSVSPALISVFD